MPWTLPLIQRAFTIFEWHVKEGLDAFKFQYDLKYWPDASGMPEEPLSVLSKSARFWSTAGIRNMSIKA